MCMLPCERNAIFSFMSFFFYKIPKALYVLCSSTHAFTCSPDLFLFLPQMLMKLIAHIMPLLQDPDTEKVIWDYTFLYVHFHSLNI